MMATGRKSKMPVIIKFMVVKPWFLATPSMHSCPVIWLICAFSLLCLPLKQNLSTVADAVSNTFLIPLPYLSTCLLTNNSLKLWTALKWPHSSAVSFVPTAAHAPCIYCSTYLVYFTFCYVLLPMTSPSLHVSLTTWNPKFLSHETDGPSHPLWWYWHH